MALDRFNASPLPNPPAEWSPQYMRQVIRVLETYHSQLDSRAANNAEQYTADRFIGGSLSGVFAATQLTTAEKNALPAVAGWVVFDTTLDKLCVYTGAAWETITSV
jgi:hypothetical protein